MNMTLHYIVFNVTFLFLCVFSIMMEGCSMAYKPDIHDSTINHQSGNKPTTDVNVDLRKK